MRGWLLRPLTLVLLVLLAALGVVIWWSTTIGPTAADLDGRITAARAAGRQVAIDVNSYNYATLPAQFATITRETTGSARTSFESRMASIKTDVTSTKLVTVAAVNDDAVVPGASAGSVPVLVALTVTEKAGTTTSSSFTVTLTLVMVPQGGTWVAESIR